MKYATALSLTLGLAMFTAQGCGRAISEGMEKALGPTGLVLPMDPKWPQADQSYLASFRNFELAPIRSEFPDTPSEFINYMPTKFREQMAGKGLPMGTSGRTLVVNVTILGYQPSSSYHKALGPTEEVVARVELTDKANGQLIGRAICIGRTYQSVGLGAKWKAWGLCRAIVNDWIDKYYPKEGRQEQEETE